VAQASFTPTRGRAVLLAVALLASYGYFYEGGGWNQNTRFDLVRAIVERRTLQIDPYQDNTGDKAAMNGHVYADKAPGASLTAVPAAALVHAGIRAVGGDPFSRVSVTALSYVATLVASGVPATMAALAVFWIALRFGASQRAAMLGAIVCGLGTPLWAYATILYGHALAAGCLAAAFLLALSLADRAASAAVVARRAYLAGLSAGWAVVTEFPAAIPCALIALFGLAMLSRERRDQLVRGTAWLGAGLATSAIALLAYNQAAFGSALHIGYTSEAGSFEAMKTGIFGINWPNPHVAAALLFGSYRGLLPLAPVLAVTPIGFWMLIRNPRTRGAGAVAAVIPTYYFLLTAGYAYWDGGWSYASRHLGPALPFLCLGLAPVWDRARGIVRIAILALAIVGVGETLVAVSTTPQPPGLVYDHPMRDLLWPAFASGDFPIGWQSVLEAHAPGLPMSELERRHIPRASWNLGQLVGLSGHASLLPLFAIWIACGSGVLRFWGSEVRHDAA
jgi:hypothetical protein